MENQEFKIGDWVVANGERHTQSNSYFPQNEIWKILKFGNGRSKTNYYVYVDSKTTKIKGQCTNADSIRKATPEEIYQKIGEYPGLTNNYEIY